MQRTLLLSFLLITPLFFSGCASYYGYSQPYGVYGGGILADCGGCGTCGTCCVQPSSPYCSPLLSQIVAPVFGFVRGQYYGGGCAGGGCSEEVYWGDYGLTPGDYCSPCTPDGYWAGSVEGSYSGELGPCGITGTCQRGLSYLYPAVGSEYNRCNPVFNDKIALTRGTSEINYGLRGPDFGVCYDSCDPCYSGCSSGVSYGEEVMYNAGSGGTVPVQGTRNGSQPCNCGKHSGDSGVIPEDSIYEEGTESVPRETIESASNRRRMNTGVVNSGTKQHRTTRTAYPTPTLNRNTVRR